MLLRTATMADLWHYALAVNWSPPGHAYDLLAAETVAGRVWCGVSADNDIIAIGGVLRVGDEPGRCWFMVTPAAAARIVETVLMARRVIRFERRKCRDLACDVADGNEAGRRLAGALGFVPTAATIANVRLWRIV